MPMQEFDVFVLCEYYTASFFMVVLYDLKCLFQPIWFYDSIL